MRTNLLIVSVAVALAAAFIVYVLARQQPRHAQWPEGYSGVFTNTDTADAAKNCTGKLYVNAIAEPRGIRQETTCNGKHRISIWLQRGETVVLDPERKVFWKPKMVARIDALRDSSRRYIGTEKIDGRTVEHYQQQTASQIAAPSAAEQSQTAEVWQDPYLHTPIKVTTAATRYELTKIKEGRQAASLFSVPDGYHEIAPPKPANRNE